MTILGVQQDALRIGRPNMSYLAVGLTVIWLTRIIVFAGRFLNFTRLLYNNLDPARDSSSTGVLSAEAFFNPASAQAINPANLTEAGRQYQKLAVRDERLAMIWSLGGLAILAGFFAPTGHRPGIGVLLAVLIGAYLWGRRIRLSRASKVERILAGGLDALIFPPILVLYVWEAGRRLVARNKADQSST